MVTLSNIATIILTKALKIRNVNVRDALSREKMQNVAENIIENTGKRYSKRKEETGPVPTMLEGVEDITLGIGKRYLKRRELKSLQAREGVAMKRYTEYHGGVAVIKDKTKHKETMAKMAAYEDTGLTPQEINRLSKAMELIGVIVKRI